MTAPRKSSDGEHPIYVIFDDREYEMLLEFKKRLSVQKARNVSNRKALSIALIRALKEESDEPKSSDVAISNNEFLERVMNMMKEQVKENKDTIKEGN